jgi:hypothetical protein
MEQVRYEGVTTEEDAIARATYDLAQLEKRSVLFSVTAAFDVLSCRRGSLVGFVHDAVARNTGFGRVIAGGTQNILLDSSVAFGNEPDVWAVTDIWVVADVWALGERTEADIRYPDGTIVTVGLTNATGRGDSLTFAAPQTYVPAGSLVAARVLAPEYRRMIVFDMKYKDDQTASLTLIDEAPEIFAA